MNRAMRMLPRVLHAAATFTMFVTASPANAGDPDGIIYVDDDAPFAGDGQSWDTAYHYLRDALTAANDPANGVSEVRVAQGTYRPDQTLATPRGSGAREAAFVVLNWLTVQGGYAGLGADDPDLIDFKNHPTILSGDLLGDDGPNYENSAENSYNVVRCTGDPDFPGPVLIGLTIMHGNADGGDYFYHPVFTGGGGIRSLPLSAEVLHCTMIANQATQGAGFYGNGSLSNCVFENNTASFRFGAGTGGGLKIVANGIIDSCAFVGNHASTRGAAIFVDEDGDAEFNACSFEGNFGEGVASTEGNGHIRLTGCSFHENAGGAVDSGIYGVFSIVQCKFTNNTSMKLGGSALRGRGVAVNSVFIGNSSTPDGGAVQLLDQFSNQGHPTSTLANCVFVNNGSDASAGAVFIDPEYSADIINCTFAGNNAQTSGGAISGPAIIANCVFFENAADAQLDMPHVAGIASVEYSCAHPPQSDFSGAGNIVADPLFVDVDGADDIIGTEDDDLHLSTGSPCIDTGLSSSSPADEFDLDKDGDTTEPIPFDFDGLPRIVGSSVDMGAFEFQQVICAADIFPPAPGSGDGVIGPGDLAELLAQWGLCGNPDTCSADIFPHREPDGTVGPGDLAELLAQWGTCE